MGRYDVRMSAGAGWTGSEITVNTRYVTLPVAARELGVHPATLRRWVDRGQVEAVTLPSGYRRFTVEQLETIKQMMGLAGKAPAAA